LPHERQNQREGSFQTPVGEIWWRFKTSEHQMRGYDKLRLGLNPNG
jgi:hypothetical protein